MGDARAPGGTRIDAETGFSLAEILVTIVIVGITFTAILTGMIVSITVSSLHRKEANADAVARSAAEWVKDSVQSPYAPCAGAGAYSLAGLSVPAGYSVSITNVEYWDGVKPTDPPTSYSPSFPWTQATCQSQGDKGLQRITITASSSDAQATEVVQIVKRVVS